MWKGKCSHVTGSSVTPFRQNVHPHQEFGVYGDVCTVWHCNVYLILMNTDPTHSICIIDIYSIESCLAAIRVNMNVTTHTIMRFPKCLLLTSYIATLRWTIVTPSNLNERQIHGNRLVYSFVSASFVCDTVRHYLWQSVMNVVHLKNRTCSVERHHVW